MEQPQPSSSTPRDKILKEFISKNDIIEKILKGEDYEKCCWYNKKTGAFCNKKVRDQSISHHSHYKILYCEKCSEKKKMNDLIEVLKKQQDDEEEEHTARGIYKTKGVPILPIPTKKIS